MYNCIIVKDVWRNPQSAISDFPPTSVCTISGRCIRRSWTMPYTSTMFSLSIWNSRRSMAMKVPVRPTPALSEQTTGRNQVRFMLCSAWSSFEGAWFGGWVACVFWETCSEPRWESVWSTGPCVLWPDVWSRWGALWFLAPRDPARLWSGIDALNGSLPFLPEGWTGSQIRFKWERGCLSRKTSQFNLITETGLDENLQLENSVKHYFTELSFPLRHFWFFMFYWCGCGKSTSGSSSSRCPVLSFGV